MSRHDRILFPMIVRFKGKKVKSFGDGILATFRSPTNALRCAMAIQDALTEFNNSCAKSEAIHVRTAVNVGEVRVERNDVFGEAVNLAARVESLAPAGEVYFTEAVYLAMNKAEIASESMGKHSLKGVPEPVNIYRVPPNAITRLVTHGAVEPAHGVMPYGGMHRLRDEYATSTLRTGFSEL